MKFSQRIGKTPVRKALQLETMDVEFENSLWNAISMHAFYPHKGEDINVNKYSTPGGDLLTSIWLHFFKRNFDEIPFNAYMKRVMVDETIKEIRTWYFYQSKWYEKYDLIEFILENDFRTKSDSLSLSRIISIILERENVGYRLIDLKFTPITSEKEIQEIEQALALNDKWSPVSIHLEAALKLLSNRRNPDYRNSVKESISAVEALLRIETGEKYFADALKELDSRLNLHAALKKGFLNIYGYTSDEDGIRHAILDDKTTVTQEDARFMLIACSAFVNYVMAKLSRKVE